MKLEPAPFVLYQGSMGTRVPAPFQNMVLSVAIRYHSEDDEVLRIIEETLERLPFQVATFAHDNVTFFSVGRGLRGQTLSATKWLVSVNPSDHHWVIVLDAHLVDQDRESAMFIVAHEIAHAWSEAEDEERDLAEPAPFDWLRALTEDKEARADAQAEEWGFRKPISDGEPEGSGPR